MPARADIDPEWFRYSGPILSRYEPYPVLTGSASGSQANSLWMFNPVVFPAPVAIKNIYLQKSYIVGVPAGTGLASTGSQAYSYKHGISFFTRQDYNTNSTNLSCITTASGGFTATLGYSSTSQQFGISWLTDASGGTSAYSTTSNDAGWSNFASGQKILQVPISGPIAGSGLTFSAGEYFVAHQHSYSTATSNSNVTLFTIGNYYIVPQLLTAGVLGSSVSLASSGDIGIGKGMASAVTTNASMPASVISAGTFQALVQYYSNV